MESAAGMCLLCTWLGGALFPLRKWFSSFLGKETTRLLQKDKTTEAGIILGQVTAMGV